MVKGPGIDSWMNESYIETERAKIGRASLLKKKVLCAMIIIDCYLGENSPAIHYLCYKRKSVKNLKERQTSEEMD